MTVRTRRGLALGVALAHAAVLAIVAWGARGSSALVAGGTWVAIAGASLALTAEAGAQRRDDIDAQPALETLTGLSLLGLVVAATIGAAASPWVLGGAVAVGAGIALRAAAMRSLGVSFATRPRADDALVEDGIHAWLRHPSEIGLLLLVTGFSLMADSAVGVAMWLALVLVAAVRVRREDAELERRYSDRYRRYRKRVRARWADKARFSRSSAKG